MSAKASSRPSVDGGSHNRKALASSGLLQNGKIHVTPVAPNRASQLRRSAAMKSQQIEDDWMMKETRDYLQRSSKPNASPVKG